MRWRSLGVAAALAAVTTGLAAQPSADKGRQLYASYCARCHGVNMAVGSAAFFDLRTLAPADRERFERSVTHGLRAMPAWGAILKPEDVQSLWLFVIDGR